MLNFLGLKFKVLRFLRFTIRLTYLSFILTICRVLKPLKHSDLTTSYLTQLKFAKVEINNSIKEL